MKNNILFLCIRNFLHVSFYKFWRQSYEIVKILMREQFLRTGITDFTKKYLRWKILKIQLSALLLMMLHIILTRMLLNIILSFIK